MASISNRRRSQLSKRPEFDNMAYSVTLSVTCLTCSLFIIYGLINIYIGKYTAGMLELFSGAAVLIFNLFFLFKKKKHNLPAFLINFITVFLSVYLYWNGGFYNTGIFWCFVFPGLYLSTQGLKRGILWVGAHLLLLSLLFILSSLKIIKIGYSGYESLAGLIVYGFSCYVLFTYEIIRSKYRQEINKLQGLLPICSVCKKICDTEGNWQTVDKYLAKKADVDFTHGLCPDCVEKHYKEYS